MTTHQQIADTMVRIRAEITHGQEQVALGRARDIERLQEQCAALGHVFVARSVFDVLKHGSSRCCAVCDASEV